jgi:FMN phosphatase YigB (HAD superfamily)
MQLIIFDFNRTIFDPDTGALMPDTREVLEHFDARQIPMVLVSRNEGGREDLLTTLDIARYFKEIAFVEDKTPELFLSLIQKSGASPQETWVVGDYLESEILHGNVIGARTVRLKRGKFADLQPRQETEPMHTIEHLRELMGLV